MTFKINSHFFLIHGRYRNINFLGEVWKGKYHAIDVAVKKLFKQDVSEAHIKELQQEVQLLSSLRRTFLFRIF